MDYVSNPRLIALDKRTPEYILRQTGGLQSQFARSEHLSKDDLLSKQEFKARFLLESVESADKVDTFEGDQLVLSNEEFQKRFLLDTEDPVTQDSSADPGKVEDAENADSAGEASTMTTPVVPKMLEASKSSGRAILDKFNVVADGSARAEFIKKLPTLELKALLTEIISETDNRKLLQSTVADLLDSLSSSVTLPIRGAIQTA